MQPDLLEEARKRRDDGMQRAADHAEAVKEGWGDTAYTYLCTYARTNHSFTTEDVRMAAEKAGDLAVPPDKRAWGSVVARAVRAGVLRRSGFVTARDPKVHCNNIALWQSLVYPGARPAPEEKPA